MPPPDEIVRESRNNAGNAKKRTGRPVGSTKLKADEDTIKQINGLARIQCTQKEAAAVLGVHRESFAAFLDTHKKARDAWESGRETGLASLRRNQFKTAETNATMQIWLGKQYLDQRDKTNVTMDDTRKLADFTTAELLAQIETEGDSSGASPEEAGHREPDQVH